MEKAPVLMRSLSRAAAAFAESVLNAIVLLDGVDGVPREIEGQRRKEEEKMPEIEIDVIL